MKFNKGDIAKVTDKSACGNFETVKGAVYIRITGTKNGYYQYDILNASMKRVSGCSGCLEDHQLMPIAINPPLGMESPKEAKFGVTWMEDEDPTLFFKTEADAKKKIAELIKDENVDKDSIYLFQVSKVQHVEQPITYKLVDVVVKTVKKAVKRNKTGQFAKKR